MNDRERRLARDREVGTTKRLTVEDVDVEAVHQTLERRLANEDRFASFERGVRSGLEPTESVESTDSTHPEGSLAVVYGEEAADGTIEYRPFGPHGAMAMVVGAIFALPSLFVTLLLVIVGYALYRIERPVAVPIEHVTVVRALVTHADAGARGREPRSFDDGAVEVVADVDDGYVVDSGRVGPLAWPQRVAIREHVGDWTALALTGDSSRETVDDVFFGHLNAWLGRDATRDVESIDDDQRAAFDDPDGWAAYREVLQERAGVEGDDVVDGEPVLDELFDGLAASIES